MRRTILPLALLLAGCSFGRPETTEWARSDATPQEAADDLQACRHAAQKRVDQDLQIDQDIAIDPASQGSLASNISQYDAEKRVNTMTHGCMQALGYHPAGKTTP